MTKAMTPEEFYSKFLAECEERWKLGDYLALGEAFFLCADNDYQGPLPRWLRDNVLEAIEFAFIKGGAPGRGKTGGYLARARRLEIDESRWLTAGVCLWLRGANGATRAKAFEEAAEMLRGRPAQGSAGAIEESYNRVQRRRRNSPK